jgi:hypothetical protein
MEVLQFSAGLCDSLRLFLSPCRADHLTHGEYSPRSVPSRPFRANLHLDLRSGLNAVSNRFGVLGPETGRVGEPFRGAEMMRLHLDVELAIRSLMRPKLHESSEHFSRALQAVPLHHRRHRTALAPRGEVADALERGCEFRRPAASRVLG